MQRRRQRNLPWRRQIRFQGTSLGGAEAASRYAWANTSTKRQQFSINTKQDPRRQHSERCGMARTYQQKSSSWWSRCYQTHVSNPTSSSAQFERISVDTIERDNVAGTRFSDKTAPLTRRRLWTSSFWDREQAETVWILSVHWGAPISNWVRTSNAFILPSSHCVSYIWTIPIFLWRNLCFSDSRECFWKAKD